MSASVFPIVPVHWRTIPDWTAPREFLPMGSRWLYVFRRPEGAGPSRLIRELWVTDDNQVCTVLEGDALEPGPVSRRPAADPTKAQRVLVLPDVHPDTETTGRWVMAWYRLVASPIRLGPATLERLRAAHTGDLAQDEVRLSAAYMIDNTAPWWFRVDEDGPLKGMFVARAVDALHLLGSLQADYAARLFAFQRWDMPLPPAPDGAPQRLRDEVEAQRRDVLDRQKQHALLELIEGLLAADPDDAGGLRGCLDLAGFERDLARVRSKRAELVKAYEDRAAKVTDWLRSDFVAAAEQAHEETGDPVDVASFLEAIYDGFLSLNASQAGVAYLQQALEDPQHVVNRYVLPPSPLAGDAFQAVRKATAAVVGIHTEILPVVVDALKDPRLAHARLLRLNHALGEAVLELVDKELMAPTVAGRVLSQQRRVTGCLIVNRQRLEALMAAAAGADAATRPRLSLVFERAVVAIEALNLATAFVGIMDEDEREVASVAGLVGSALDLASALENPITTRQLAGLTGDALEESTLFYTRAFRLAGGFSATIDIVLALVAVEEARQVSDESVMVGNGLIAAGSVLGLVGVAGLVAAPLLPWVVGAGLVLVAAGTIITSFTSNTPWQVFLEHCRWGRPGMWVGTDTPNWSPVPLDQLKASLDAQIEALMNLFVSCTLKAEATCELAMTPGLLGDGATFQVVLHARWDTAVPYGSSPGSWRRYELELPWGQAPRVIAGDPDDFRATYTGADGLSPAGTLHGPAAITGPGSGYGWATYIGEATWYIRLDLQGDGSMIAPAGKWLRVDRLTTRTFAEGTVLDREPPLPTSP